MLILAATLAIAAPPLDTWQMGGGRAWITPPKLGRDRELQDALDSVGPRTTVKEEWEKVAKEVARIQSRAQGGDVTAMRSIGFMLLNGIWVRRDQDAAQGWFYEAALRGDATSMYVLGCGFRLGVGVSPDPKLSQFWLAKAARAGVEGTCR